MCKRCEQYFTIHDADELAGYLKCYTQPGEKEDALKLWWDRGYFTNLIYLEYLSGQKKV